MTEERLKKIEEVLQHRQYGLGVVLENVEDPHNIAAVLRTCDAAGIQDVYVIDPAKRLEDTIGWKSSRSATKWMTVHHFDRIQDCVQVLRQRFNMILTTGLQNESRSLYETDLTGKLALVFGNEIRGLSSEMMQHSDGNLIIPQHGMLQSLNISVACAVTIFEALRQRTAKGLYDQTSLPEKMYNELYEQWTIKRKSIGK